MAGLDVAIDHETAAVDWARPDFVIPLALPHELTSILQEKRLHARCEIVRH
jgi:hypothetical protein